MFCGLPADQIKDIPHLNDKQHERSLAFEIHLMSTVVPTEQQSDSLQEQIRALGRANASTEELLAELEQARELESLLTQRNRELQFAQALEADRNRVLELVVRNEPISTVFDALFQLIQRQLPDSCVAVTALHELRIDCYFSPTMPERMKRELRRSIRAINWQDVLAGRSSARSTLHVEMDRIAAENCKKKMLTAGIQGASGRTIGTMQLFADKDAGAEVELIFEKCTVLASFILEHFQLYDELAFQAQHDALTGLPNRTLFEERLRQAIGLCRRTDRRFALFWVDLDRFKLINDTLGHHVGDELLYQVACRLRSSFRGTDTVARLGGDEFAIILTEIEDLNDLDRIAEKLISRMEQPMRIQEHELVVTGSVGIACFPDHADDMSSLLRAADVAMYEAKAAGKNAYHLFTPANAEGLETRLLMERNLRGAIQKGEMSLHYQPQCGNDGNIMGMEALVRWTSARLGNVSPAAFIPIAEATGLIIPLGDWVLEEACQQAARWKAEGMPMRVAINVSAQQFLRQDFCQKVSDVLKQHELPADLLELEVTESCIATHPEQCNEQLQRLRQLGISVSIDDFGTGYSSLSRLQEMAIDSIKIDRQFIANIRSDQSHEAIALVQAILRMAESLKLRVVAEGVETAEQLEVLRNLGCMLSQGYYFYRPQAAENATRLLRSRRDEMAP